MQPQSINLTNAFVVSLYRHSLFATALLWLTGLSVILMLVVALSRVILRFNLSPEGVNEPPARTYLRWGFGALWLVDGVLQFQPSMPLGLANNVVAPMTVNTPSWLHSLMEHGIFLWNMHPIAFAVGVAWLQVGIGLALLVANGRTSRVVGAISAGWALLIWLVGNAAGGLFVARASFLFGWPGASLLYAFAGIWLAVDSDTFRRRFSAVALRSLSALVMAAAILQCLPSTGFWHGGSTNSLVVMANDMTKISQPHWLSATVRSFGQVAALMGGGFNLVVVMWLVTCGVGLWMSVSRTWRWPVWTLVIGCGFFWFVSQDTSLFGGLATDVNTMLPVAVLAWCASPKWRTYLPRRRRLPRELTSSAGAVVATFAAAMILFSLVSMGAATFASAETTFFMAQNGPASATSGKAPAFTLTDQFRQTYSLGEHARRVTLLAFLDPRCWADCPLLAQQLKELRGELPANANLDIVAVAIDPYHEKISDLRHFIAQRGLSHVKNFYFVTGRLSVLRHVWRAYGIGVSMTKKDKMSIHSDFMYIINPQRQLRWIVPDSPLAGAAGQASAVSELRGLLALEGVH